MWIGEISGRGSPSKTETLAVSTLVNTEEKYLAKTFALDNESVTVVPWYSSGPMPTRSCFLF